MDQRAGVSAHMHLQDRRCSLTIAGVPYYRSRSLAVYAWSTPAQFYVRGHILCKQTHSNGPAWSRTNQKIRSKAKHINVFKDPCSGRAVSERILMSENIFYHMRYHALSPLQQLLEVRTDCHREHILLYENIIYHIPPLRSCCRCAATYT